MTFVITVPDGNAPVTSRPHRINPIVAKEVVATLIQYLVASLIQHLASPYSSPLVVIPKKSGGVRITVNYKKLNQISRLSQLPISRVDQVLEPLVKGLVFFLFNWSPRSTRLPSTRTLSLSRRFAPPRASTSGSSYPKAAVRRSAGSRK